MGWTDASTRAAVRPGPKSLMVAGLAHKVDRLLQLAGRQQKWLAASMGVTEQAVANWKASGQLPAARVGSLARLLGVPTALIEEPDAKAFEDLASAAFAPGEGLRWRALAGQAADGLDVLPELAGVPSMRLAGLSETPSPARRLQPRFAVGDRARIFLRDAPGVLPAGTSGRAFIFVEDSERLHCACPTALHAAFGRAPGGWSFPSPDAEPLHLNEPAGQHRVVVVLTEASVDAADIGLPHAGEALRAADFLAERMATEGFGCAILAARFFLIPA